MNVSRAAKVTQISEHIAKGATPKQAILDAIGDLSGIEVLSDLVLLGTFIRSEKRASGLVLPQEVVGEDEYQGKVGLVLKSGPIAYGNWEENDEVGSNARVGTWVVYHVGDAKSVTINGTPCRLVPYDKLRLRVSNPESIY